MLLSDSDTASSHDDILRHNVSEHSARGSAASALTVTDTGSSISILCTTVNLHTSLPFGSQASAQTATGLKKHAGLRIDCNGGVMRIGSPRKAPDIGKNTNMKYAAEWLAAVTLFLAFAYNVSVLYLPPLEGAQPLDVVFRTLAVALCGYFIGIAFSGNIRTVEISESLWRSLSFLQFRSRPPLSCLR